MERNDSTALVIGAGVAGPLTALALRKIGWDVVLLDDRAAGDASAEGAWLTVAVNGLSAMRTLGVDAAVKACGFPSRTIELCSAAAHVGDTARVLGAVPLGGELPDGTATHTVRRGALCDTLLRAALAAGVRVEHRWRLSSIEEDARGVIATSADGAVHRGALLVGADGIHSTVRRWIDPHAGRPRPAGLGDIGGFTPRAALPDDVAALEPGVYRMLFGARAFFGYTVAPDGDVWWFANPTWRDENALRALRSLPEPAQRRAIAALFDGDRGPMAPLVEHARGPLVATLQSSLPRVRRWARGRVVLVGDAAHAAKPSSGQGVSMAAEDAVELARCLRDVSDVPGAARAFVSLRKSRCEAVVRYGDRNASGKAAGPIASRVRDAMLPFVLRQVARSHGRTLAWLFEHRIEWDAKVASPEGDDDVNDEKDTKLATLAMGWSGWGSPVGLSILLVSIGVFLVCLRQAGLLP